VTAPALAARASGLNRRGQEIEGRMAVTVLGGLISSTLFARGAAGRRSATCACEALRIASPA